MRLLQRLAILLRWRRFQSELDEEMRFHEQMLRDDGAAPRTFGNPILARNEARAPPAGRRRRLPCHILYLRAHHGPETRPRRGTPGAGTLNGPARLPM